MAYGNTISTHLVSFVGPPDISGVPIGWGTGTKMAMGWCGTAASGAITMVGDIQKKGGTPPAGSSYGTALPNTDVIKSAFLFKPQYLVASGALIKVLAAASAPTDITNKASITADNQVTLAGLSASASNCLLFVLYDAQDKMGSKN